MKGRWLTTEEFIEKSIFIHGNKYDYSQVNFIGGRVDVKLICKIHGEFNIKPSYHLYRKVGCKKCKTQSTMDENFSIFENKSKEIYKNKYDYSLVNYINSKKKVDIICPEHGVFKQTPGGHLVGGCLKCGQLKTSESNKLDSKKFINEVKVIHKNKYNYSLVYYVKSNIKVKIICPEHGVFKQTPNNHNRGKGCLKCGLESSSKIRANNTESFINKAKKIHGEKYNYSIVDYKRAKVKVEIICKKHGIYLQTPNNHLNGKRCPSCVESNGERDVRNWLQSNGINFESQKKFDGCKYKLRLRFDFYLPKYNICIEYNGIQHYESVKYFGGEESLKLQKKRDNIKKDFCNESNIELLIIKYNQNVDDILTERFN
jgi:hypothetical protein